MIVEKTLPAAGADFSVKEGTRCGISGYYPSAMEGALHGRNSYFSKNFGGGGIVGGVGGGCVGLWVCGCGCFWWVGVLFGGGVG